MLTTRREDIESFSFGVQSHVHKIQPLEGGDAWELFSMKAFSSDLKKSCSPELLPSARELVEKCEGLPLAIVALSGLMSSKKSLKEWSIVYNSLNWHLTNNSLLQPMKMHILLFSFNDFPYRLRQCFLYCSLFPEGHVIIMSNKVGANPKKLGHIAEHRNPVSTAIGKAKHRNLVSTAIDKAEHINPVSTTVDKAEYRNSVSTAIGKAEHRNPMSTVADKAEHRNPGLISRKAIGVRIPSSISKMKKLQTLAYIESEGNIIRLIGNMTQLTFLGILNVKEIDEENLCPFPLSLTNLNLHESRLEEDLLSHIEALPSLHSLCLDNASVRKELCFNRGFVKLRHLWFWDLALLNKITIEKGAMPNLEFLGIRSCLTLETLP
ncbi:hypothetical protein PRUPE_6G200600 [Prunus persica]|uniref:Uncharacterized protein n=1 Tax=Prunus persica TaxID=3760 RepID=M5WHS0_PRUPE|nr:hypothetical protein PRUPE_6G200600 [Prunus persica]